MKKSFTPICIGLIVSLAYQNSKAKVYSTIIKVESIGSFSDCFNVTYVLFEDHDTTIPTDDTRIGIFNTVVGSDCQPTYEGGLIDRSRPFCSERDGKVFTFDEITAFGTLDDKYGGYIKKDKGKLSGKYSANYNPFFHQGGHGCRHSYSYIPDMAAIRDRPELAQIWNMKSVQISNPGKQSRLFKTFGFE